VQIIPPSFKFQIIKCLIWAKTTEKSILLFFYLKPKFPFDGNLSFILPEKKLFFRSRSQTTIRCRFYWPTCLATGRRCSLTSWPWTCRWRHWSRPTKIRSSKDWRSSKQSWLSASTNAALFRLRWYLKKICAESIKSRINNLIQKCKLGDLALLSIEKTVCRTM